MTIPEIFAAKLSAYLSAEPHGRQLEIAEAVGISPSRMNNIVRGRRDGGEDLRRAICRYLKVEYEVFLFGAGQTCEPELQEFIALYREYGTPAFLRACTWRLMEIRDVVEK